MAEIDNTESSIRSQGADTEKTESPAKSYESAILDVVYRARDEIMWVRSAYKLAMSLVAVVIISGFYFSYKSIQELKSDLLKNGERFQTQLKAESSLFTRTLQKDLENEIDRIRGEVDKRVEKEFRQDNISTLVAAQAQKRIDVIADSLIEKQIGLQINPLQEELTALISRSSSELKVKIEELDRELAQSKKTEKELRRLLTEARETVSHVEEQSDFVLAVLAAQSDDRDAYERLLLWSSDNSYPLQQEAKAAVHTVRKDHVSSLNDAHVLLQWDEGFDPSTMTIDEIKNRWTICPTEFARAYVEFVWKHENIAKEEKMAFLQEALKDSRGSLQAAHWAAKTLAKEAKIDYSTPFVFSGIEKWWSERDGTVAPQGSAAE